MKKGSRSGGEFSKEGEEGRKRRRGEEKQQEETEMDEGGVWKG